MRDLASLGISPAPWKASNHGGVGVVLLGENAMIVEPKLYSESWANACFIAAATTMYKTLFDEYNFLNAIYEEMPNEQIERRMLAIADALAAASGESEVAK